MRTDGREAGRMREVKVTRRYQKDVDGSVMIEMGHTRVICAATVEEKAPPFLRDSGMLPRSSSHRIGREAARGKQSGRTQEIQRLIGRSLRAVLDQEALGERTVTIDCDVIQADGGTRCAAITGGFIALVDALRPLVKSGVLEKLPLKDYVAAVSVGIVDGEARLDLHYDDDSAAEVDMNVVATGKGELIEVGATGEGATFPREMMDTLLDMALGGVDSLVAVQKKELGQL